MLHRLSLAQMQQQMIGDLRRRDDQHQAEIHQLTSVHEDKLHDDRQQYNILKTKYFARYVYATWMSSPRMSFWGAVEYMLCANHMQTALMLPMTA